MDILPLLERAVGGFLIAIVSAYVTVRLAFKRFYSEKQWERKADAYTKIIVALHHLKNFCDHQLAEIKYQDGLPKGEESENAHKAAMDNLLNSSLDAVADLRLQVDIGTFAISPQAVSALQELLSNLEKSVEVGKKHGFQKYLEFKLDAVRICLATVQVVARKDLSVGWK